MVMYPMKDLIFLQGQEFREIASHKDNLANGKMVDEVVDVSVRTYTLIQKHEP